MHNKTIFMVSSVLGILALMAFQTSFAQKKSGSASKQVHQSRPSSTSTQYINPRSLANPVGYTHVVKAGRGKTLYIAGQVASDHLGNLVGPGDMRAQAQQVFENLKAALEAGGASFSDVVKLNYYVVDASQLPAVREVRDRFVNTAHPPASTAVEVKRLFREGYLIEVEAVAVTPE